MAFSRSRHKRLRREMRILAYLQAQPQCDEDRALHTALQQATAREWERLTGIARAVQMTMVEVK